MLLILLACSGQIIFANSKLLAARGSLPNFVNASHSDLEAQILGSADLSQLLELKNEKYYPDPSSFKAACNMMFQTLHCFVARVHTYDANDVIAFCERRWKNRDNRILLLVGYIALSQ